MILDNSVVSRTDNGYDWVSYRSSTTAVYNIADKLTSYGGNIDNYNTCVWTWDSKSSDAEYTGAIEERIAEEIKHACLPPQ
ncbi:MAG: hypothetical protein ACYC1M_19050 [Armatimonadota bacterium]